MTSAVNNAVPAEQTVGVVPPLKKGGEGGFKDSYQELGDCKGPFDCLAQKIISSNSLFSAAFAGAVTRGKWVKVGNRLVLSDDGPPYYADKLRQESKSPEEMVTEAFKLLERVDGKDPNSRKFVAANRDAFRLFGWAAREHLKREEFVEAAEAFGWQGDLRGKVDADTSVFFGIYSSEAEAWLLARDAAKDQRRRAYLTHRYGNALIKTGMFDEGNAEIDSAVAYYEGTARNAKLRRFANGIIAKIRSYQATLLLERGQPELAAVSFERAAEATDGRGKAEMFKRAILLKNAGDAWMRSGRKPAAALIDYRRAKGLLEKAGRADSPLDREIEQLRREAAGAALAKAHEVTDPPGAGPKDDKRLPKETDVPGAGNAGKFDRKLLERAAQGNSDALRRLESKVGRDFVERLRSGDRKLLEDLKRSGVRPADIDRLVMNAKAVEGDRGVTDSRRRRELIERRGK